MHQLRSADSRGVHDSEHCNGLIIKIDGSFQCIECGVSTNRSVTCPECGTSLESGTTPAVVSLRGQVAITDIEASLARHLQRDATSTLETDETLSAIAKSHADDTVEEAYFRSRTQVPSLSEELEQHSLSIDGYQTSTVEGYPTGRSADDIAVELYDTFLMEFLDRQTNFTHIGVGACWNPHGGIRASIIAAGRLAQVPGNIMPSRLERNIHTEINTRRTEHGYSQLTYDSHLASIAATHSRAMASENFFAHEAPDGTTMNDRYRELNYSGDQAGENIAKQYATVTDDVGAVATDIVDGWMSSAGHRENILDSGFSNEGIGVFQSNDGALLVTQNFS